MTLQEIKDAYKNLPHIKTVWILDGKCFLVPVRGAEKISLDNVKLSPSEAVEAPKKEVVVEATEVVSETTEIKSKKPKKNK